MNGDNEMALPCRVDCHEVCAYHFCICPCHGRDLAAVALPEPDVTRTRITRKEVH